MPRAGARRWATAAIEVAAPKASLGMPERLSAARVESSTDWINPNARM